MRVCRGHFLPRTLLTQDCGIAPDMLSRLRYYISSAFFWTSRFFLPVTFPLVAMRYAMFLLVTGVAFVIGNMTGELSCVRSPDPFDGMPDHKSRIFIFAVTEGEAPAPFTVRAMSSHHSPWWLTHLIAQHPSEALLVYIAATGMSSATATTWI